MTHVFPLCPFLDYENPLLCPFCAQSRYTRAKAIKKSPGAVTEASRKMGEVVNLSVSREVLLREAMKRNEPHRRRV